jgi:hypothetical protein
VYAYRLPECTPQQISGGKIEHPSGARLNHAGPWQLAAHPHGGSLATWRGAPHHIGAYGEPQECADGLLYYPSKVPLTPEALARPRVPESVTIETHSGVTLAIPIATRSPRRRMFAAASKVGGYIDEYPRLVFSIYDRLVAKEPMPMGDPDLCRMVFLAIAGCYRVTEEAMDQAGWLSTFDDDLIMGAAFGTNPKAEAAAGGTSP